ncbi:myosin heavy chain, fast skeletal muscle-like [Seriola dumerili]|uniref:myosin heavy chain, fast skeletal muscle-like n=1 Tax=Seriola dumerili TaxID=41447 RepID=UPI000BBE93D8|nr:myosin heavy chain, fast skeletal muscle-like [Seriola dumerili]
MSMKLEELQRTEAMTLKKRAEKGACSPTVEGLLQQLEEAKRQHSAEKLMLTAELTAAIQQLTDVNQQLEREKHSRMQVEADKLEAVEIADILLKTIEDMQRASEERSAELKSEKSKQDQLHLEIQKLQKEKDLRIQAEAETQFMHMKLEELNELQRTEAMTLEKRAKNGACSPTVEELLQQHEEGKGQNSDEKRMVTPAKQQLKNLNQQLEREKHLRMQVEADKLEAVEIADTLFKTIDDMQRASEECSAELKSEKSKQDQLHVQILQLQQTLQQERDLTVQAEAETLIDFRNMEVFYRDFNRQLQAERKLRAEVERSRLEAVKISEALFQTLEEVRMVTERLSAESQMLADKLKQEGKKQEAQVQDTKELTQMLKREMALRNQSENYELETFKVVEALQRKIKQLRKMHAAKTSCWNRRRAAH